MIVLAIIGVVAALTVPTTINKYQKKTQVLQLRSTINDIESAADAILLEESKKSLASTTLFTDATNGVGNFLTTYFKVASDCGTTVTPCFAQNYKNIDGTANNGPTFAANRGGNHVVLLSNGAALATSRNPAVFYNALYVQVDTNGANGPNIAGRDFFDFYLLSDGSVSITESDPASKPSYTRDYLQSLGAGCTSNGGGCFALLLYNGWKMDY